MEIKTRQELLGEGIVTQEDVDRFPESFPEDAVALIFPKFFDVTDFTREILHPNLGDKKSQNLWTALRSFGHGKPFLLLFKKSDFETLVKPLLK